MASNELKYVRNMILALAALLAGVAAMALLFAGFITPVSFLFLILGFSLMSSHWVLLAGLVESLFSGNRAVAALKGMGAAFPLLLAFGLVLAASRIGRTNALLAIVGMATLPLAQTFYALFAGFFGRRDKG